MKRESRSSSIKKHIGLGAIFRVGGIILNLAVISVTYKLLQGEKFGIWVTLLTIINWLSFFDMGLGNGLRNKVTEELSKNNIKKAKEYISTTYIVMGIVALFISGIYLFISRYVSWDRVFNTNLIGRSEMYILMGIIVVGALINFATSLSIQLFYSIQRASMGSLGNFISQGITLVMLYSFYILGAINLQGVALINMGAIIFTNLILNYIFFRKHQELKPTFKDFKGEDIVDLVSLGGKFFIIQLSSVVILTTDNMIITRLLGPEYVTNYNIVSKLFSLIIIGHSIVLAPMWSAYTAAYIRTDKEWLKKSNKMMYLFMILILIGVALLIYIYPFIIKLWIGRGLDINNNLVILFGVYTVIYTWSNLHMHLLNGLGRVDIQFPIWLIQGIINIPLSIYLVRRFDLGVIGVILGTILSLVPFSIIAPIELQRVVSKMGRNDEL